MGLYVTRTNLSYVASTSSVGHVRTVVREEETTLRETIASRARVAEELLITPATR